MYWSFLLFLFLLVACSKPEPIVITEVVYKTDTIYVDIGKPIELFPWELSCSDSADTQSEMNKCAGDCFLISDSITEQLFRFMQVDLDQKEHEKSEEQKVRLQKMHDAFGRIKIISKEYQEIVLGEGSQLPLIKVTTMTWINQFEYELLSSFTTDIFKG